MLLSDFLKLSYSQLYKRTIEYALEGETEKDGPPYFAGWVDFTQEWKDVDGGLTEVTLEYTVYFGADRLDSPVEEFFIKEGYVLYRALVERNLGGFWEEIISEDVDTTFECLCQNVGLKGEGLCLQATS